MDGHTSQSTRELALQNAVLPANIEASKIGLNITKMKDKKQFLAYPSFSKCKH